MALQKCPRCELNYILDGGNLCIVCREEVHGKKEKEELGLVCSVCGDAPALPGQDMCKACLAEFRSIEMTATGAEDEDDAPLEAELEPEPVSSLSEMEALELDADVDLEEELEDEEEDALLMEEFAEAQ